MLYPFSTPDCLPPPHRPNVCIGNYNLTSTLLHSLLSSDGRGIHIDSPISSMESLCALSLLGSHGDRLPGSMKRNSRAGHPASQNSSNGRRLELLELALHKWLCSHSTTPSSDILMLYHVVHLSIYTNFSQICRTMRSIFAQERTTDREPRTPPVNGGENTDREHASRPSVVQELKSCFGNDDHEQKAVWHAKSIFTLAQGAERVTEPKPGERVHLLKRASNGESIHYSHAIYYASMVLWCSKTYRIYSTGKKGDSGSGESLAIVQALREGISFLTRSASRVAEIYKHTLEILEAAKW